MDVFARKLQSLATLDDLDLSILNSACRDIRIVDPGVDIILQGETTEFVHLVMSGFAFRYKLTASGGRQIFGYLLPGDLCDLHVALLDRVDHSIGTISPCEIALVSRETILDLTERHPRISRALLLNTLVDEATLREWLLNLGQRSAVQRLAHLFCEIHARLQAIGLDHESGFALPITQAVLADTIGISAVHVNRSLRVLRENGLVTFGQQMVEIPDLEKLRQFAGFDPAYLHLRAVGGSPASPH